MRTVAAAVALVLALLSPTGAFAGKEKKALLVLRVEGEGLDSDTLAKLDAATRKQTAESTRPSKLLPPPALDFEAMRVAAGCSEENARCLATIGDTLSATHVVRVKITGTKFSITTVRVKDGKAGTATIDVPTIDAIAIEELRYAIAGLFGDKRPAPPKRAEPPGGLQLVSANPDVALDDVEIFLDDKKFPVSALRSLPLGPHQLEVHKPGYEPFLWSGAVKPGTQTKVSVELRALPGNDEKETPAVVAEKDPKKEPKKELKKDTPPAKKDTVAMLEPKTNSDPVIVAPVRAPIEEPRLFYTWMAGGGAVAMTVVGLAGWAYLNTIEGRLVDSCGGEGFVMEDQNGVKRCIGGDPAYTGCPETGPQPARCKNGQLASTLTYVGFVGAAVLGAATVTAFFVEGGPAVLSGRRSSEADLDAAIIPLEGGAAASFTARF